MSSQSEIELEAVRHITGSETMAWKYNICDGEKRPEFPSISAISLLTVDLKK